MTTSKIREIPFNVANTLRAVHRLIVLRGPYAEVTAAIDVAAALTEATDRELIALERLETLRRYPVDAVTDDEVEEVLRKTEIERAAMPMAESAWWLSNACWGRPMLVLRHLVPRLAELERQVPDDEETLDALREQIAIAQGNAPTPVNEIDESQRVPTEIVEAMRYGHALRQMGWPPDAVFEVLDAAETLPAAVDWMATLAHDRVIVGHLYELPEADMERMIQHALRVHGEAPAWLLASTIATAAGRHPALAAKYLPTIVPRAEEELRARPDVNGEHMLDRARRVLEQALMGARMPDDA